MSWKPCIIRRQDKVRVCDQLPIKLLRWRFDKNMCGQMSNGSSVFCIRANKPMLQGLFVSILWRARHWKVRVELLLGRVQEHVNTQMLKVPIILHIMRELTGLRDMHQEFLPVQRHMPDRLQSGFIPMPIVMPNKQPHRHDNLRQLSIIIMRLNVSHFLLRFQLNAALFKGLSCQLLPIWNNSAMWTVYQRV